MPGNDRGNWDFIHTFFFRMDWCRGCKASWSHRSYSWRKGCSFFHVVWRYSRRTYVCCCSRKPRKARVVYHVVFNLDCQVLRTSNSRSYRTKPSDLATSRVPAHLDNSGLMIPSSVAISIGMVIAIATDFSVIGL